MKSYDYLLKLIRCYLGDEFSDVYIEEWRDVFILRASEVYHINFSIKPGDVVCSFREAIPLSTDPETLAKSICQACDRIKENLARVRSMRG